MQPLEARQGWVTFTRLRARLLLSAINWRTPSRRSAIIPDYLGDLWLLCHFHTTGLIAPNGGRFLRKRMREAVRADRPVTTINCNLVYSFKDSTRVDILTHLKWACGDVSERSFLWWIGTTVWCIPPGSKEHYRTNSYTFFNHFLLFQHILFFLSL